MQPLHMIFNFKIMSLFYSAYIILAVFLPASIFAHVKTPLLSSHIVTIITAVYPTYRPRLSTIFCNMFEWYHKYITAVDKTMYSARVVEKGYFCPNLGRLNCRKHPGNNDSRAHPMLPTSKDSGG